MEISGADTPASNWSFGEIANAQNYAACFSQYWFCGCLPAIARSVGRRFSSTSVRTCLLARVQNTREQIVDYSSRPPSVGVALSSTNTGRARNPTSILTNPVFRQEPDHSRFDPMDGSALSGARSAMRHERHHDVPAPPAHRRCTLVDIGNCVQPKGKRPSGTL